LINDNRATGLNDPANDVYVGRMYLFGTGDTIERWTPVTKNPGVTGVSGRGGWYLDLDNEPSTLILRTVNIPLQRSLIFAVSYPLNTQFVITQFSKSFTVPFHYWYPQKDQTTSLITSTSLLEIDQQIHSWMEWL